MKYSLIKLSDGKEYKFAFTLGCLIEIENKYGSIEKWEKIIVSDDINVSAIIFLLSIGLKKFHPEIDEEYLIQNVSITDFSRITTEVSKAVTSAMRQSSDNNNNNHKNNNKKKY